MANALTLSLRFEYSVKALNVLTKLIHLPNRNLFELVKKVVLISAILLAWIPILMIDLAILGYRLIKQSLCSRSQRTFRNRAAPPPLPPPIDYRAAEQRYQQMQAERARENAQIAAQLAPQVPLPRYVNLVPPNSLPDILSDPVPLAHRSYEIFQEIFPIILFQDSLRESFYRLSPDEQLIYGNLIENGGAGLDNQDPTIFAAKERLGEDKHIEIFQWMTGCFIVYMLRMQLFNHRWSIPRVLASPISAIKEDLRKLSQEKQRAVLLAVIHADQSTADAEVKDILNKITAQAIEWSRKDFFQTQLFPQAWATVSAF